MNNGIRKAYFAPLLLFILLIICLLAGLYWQHRNLPSPLLGKTAPSLTLPSLQYPKRVINRTDWLGHMAVVNVWATWCLSCMQEHPFLLQLARQQQISIYGLDYKDNRPTAIAWLKRYGNPYRQIAFDSQGQTAINWGVYGTPETFLLDAKGIIRYKHVGPIDYRVWQQEFVPIIRRYQS